MNPVLEFFKTLMYSGLEKYGRYYSTYRAFVINREDPGFYGRLQLNIPIIHGKSFSPYWAWPKHNFSGLGYGAQALPQKGDLVWVEFEYGNPKKPIWSFGHFGTDSKSGQKEKPSNLTDYNNYWFKTPEGLTVEFNDTLKKITLTHPTLGVICIDPESIFFGNTNNTMEPAVLGDKTADLLNNLVGSIQALTLALTTQVSTDAIAATASGFTGYVALLTSLQNVTQELLEIKTNIPSIKSPIVKLN